MFGKCLHFLNTSIFDYNNINWAINGIKVIKSNVIWNFLRLFKKWQMKKNLNFFLNYKQRISINSGINSFYKNNKNKKNNAFQNCSLISLNTMLHSKNKSFKQISQLYGIKH